MQRILTAAVLALLSISAGAQQFPVKGKPIYLVVTFAAGRRHGPDRALDGGGDVGVASTRWWSRTAPAAAA